MTSLQYLGNEKIKILDDDDNDKDNNNNNMKHHHETRNDKIIPMRRKSLPRRTSSSRKKRNTKHHEETTGASTTSRVLENARRETTAKLERCLSYESVSSLNSSDYGSYSACCLDHDARYYYVDGEDDESSHIDTIALEPAITSSSNAEEYTNGNWPFHTTSSPENRWNSRMPIDPPPESPRRRSLEYGVSNHQKGAVIADLLPIQPRRATIDTLPMIPLRHWDSNEFD